jgi:NAD(P)-dependent dehydrogenase (short-subunit alcohol dehydrogenase family)
VNDFPRFDLEGRTALVTGAARGLGNAIALALAHAGADVALGLRDPASGADLADQIEGMGRHELRLPMDVRDLDQVRAAVDATVGQLGRLDILVNNAGLGPGQPRRGRPEADFDLTMDVNV